MGCYLGMKEICKIGSGVKRLSSMAESICPSSRTVSGRFKLKNWSGLCQAGQPYVISFS